MLSGRDVRLYVRSIRRSWFDLLNDPFLVVSEVTVVLGCYEPVTLSSTQERFVTNQY